MKSGLFHRTSSLTFNKAQITVAEPSPACCGTGAVGRLSNDEEFVIWSQNAVTLRRIWDMILPEPVHAGQFELLTLIETEAIQPVKDTG